jgi:hypothetical protein
MPVGRYVTRRLLLGATAGAAATTALNATTYLDMAVRGRPASSTPEQTVEKMASSLDVPVPGDDSTRGNRLSGIGALLGLATGVGTGIGYGVLDMLHLRPRGLTGALLVGGGAMAASNGSMVAYGVTDPRTWDAAAWVSDLVPHAVFGAALVGAYSLADGSRGRAGGLRRAR